MYMVGGWVHPMSTYILIRVSLSHHLGNEGIAAYKYKHFQSIFILADLELSGIALPFFIGAAFF